MRPLRDLALKTLEAAGGHLHTPPETLFGQPEAALGQLPGDPGNADGQRWACGGRRLLLALEAGGEGAGVGLVLFLIGVVAGLVVGGNGTRRSF